MAKFECNCGNILSNSRSPNDIEYHVYSDFEWNKILANNVIDSISIPRPQYEVWKCPKCQRLYIFENDILVRTYIAESK